MTIEVTKTISTDSRNTLVRNRDELQHKYGITIFFPRDKVRGAYQDMILKGGPNAIAKAQRHIDTILAAWNDEFNAFKHRQAHKKHSRRIHTIHIPPTHTTYTHNPITNNPFASLQHTSPTPYSFTWSDDEP
jgi:hypothetical protein